MEKRPRDFDWVTAQHDCSVTAVFAYLQDLAKRNVESRNATMGGEPVQFSISAGDGYFVVIRDGNLGQGSVTFRLRQSDIEIERGGQSSSVTLTLNNEGHCKLLIEGVSDHLDPWQVLRRALEPIFFPANPPSRF
jgi:hypothetical protein